MESTRDIRANWDIIGHDWAVEFLRRGLLNGRSRHAYLISGSPSLGKMKLALAFAMALNCEDSEPAQRPCMQCRACQAISRSIDPDLVLPKAEDGSPLKIDAIRDVTRTLALQPYASRYRVAIFDDFDLVAPLAQDALLKTLEEPASYAVIILLASSLERILPTIRSRAQLIHLRPVSQQLIKDELIQRGSEQDQADLIARLSSGRMGWALAAAQDEALLTFRGEMLDLLSEILSGGRLQRIKSADQLSRKVGRDNALLRDILEIWQTWWRDVLLESYDSPVKPCNSDRKDEIRAWAMRAGPESARSALESTRQTMQSLNTNANLRLMLDALFLEYPGLD